MNNKVIGISVLLLALLAACGGAPAAPISAPISTPTANSVSARQIPTATSTAALTPTREPAAQPTPQNTTPAGAFTVSPAGITADVPVLIAPGVDGLQSFSADGRHLQTFDQAQLSLGRNLSAGIAPSGGQVAFVSGDNPMTPEREGSGPLHAESARHAQRKSKANRAAVLAGDGASDHGGCGHVRSNRGD